MKRTIAPAIIALVATALLIFTPAPTSTRGIASAPPTRAHTAPDPTTTFAAVGDSITALTSHTGEPRGELSWVNWASSPHFVHAGGYAESGMTSVEMSANMSPPFTADVLVIMAGTNDVMKYVPIATSMSCIDDIVARSGISTVVISAIAPTDRDPAAALEYNSILSEHALERGWSFVDPWVPFRAADGTWIPGTAYDQFHPTGPTQSVIGATLRTAAIAAARMPA